MDQESLVKDTITELLEERGPTKSICPSEVARKLFSAWRPEMPLIRQVARQMAREGQVIITQKERVLSPDAAFKGPIRLRLPDAKF